MKFETPELYLTLAIFAALSFQLFFVIWGGTQALIVKLIRFFVILSLSLSFLNPHFEKKEGSSRIALLVDISESHDEATANELLSDLKSALPEETSLSVVPFGKRAANLEGESSPSSLSSLRRMAGRLDSGETNIEAALKEGSILGSKDLILISDGHETEGDSLKAAESLVSKGIRIFPILPKGEGIKRQVFRISNLHAPLRAPLGKSVDIRVSLENSTDLPQSGTLVVTHDGHTVLTEKVAAESKSSRIVIAKSDPSKEGIKEIVAVLTPDDSSIPKSSAHSLLSGETKDRVIMLSGNDADERFLKDVLTDEAFKLSSFKGEVTSSDLEAISSASLMILNNVPASSLPSGGASTLKSFVQGGGGLIMIGGDKSFGLGGYIGSPLEEVLPVKLLPPQSEKKRLNIAIQLVLDKSRSMASDGKLDSTKAAAKEVIRGLKDEDLIGVTAFDSSPFAVIPLATLRQNRQAAIDRIGILFPTGKTNLMPAMDIARQSLENARAGRKHMIVLTDGELPDGSPAYVEFVKQMRFSGITISTVLIGPEFDSLLRRMAEVGGGAFYNTSDPSTLPRIFLRDVQVRSGEQTMKENLEYFVRSGPGKLESTTARSFPSVLGYVQTLEKEGSNLELVVLADGKADPLLASGQFGAGKAIAFTSDANGRWSKNWAPWGGFRSFWREIVESAQNKSGSELVKYDLKYFVERGSIIIDLTILSGGRSSASRVTGEMTHPDKRIETVPFNQISEGRYQGKIENPSAGRYEFKGTVGSSPISPVGLYVSGELFGEKKGEGYNTSFLETLASRTGGRTNPSKGDLASGGAVKIVKDPKRDLFLWAALMLLLLEILVREGVAAIPVRRIKAIFIQRSDRTSTLN